MQPPPISQRARFERITTADGLSFFIVRPILQDRQGFIWIGTYGGGLNRYDGYEFTVYKNEPGDPETLSHDVVQALYEDRDGDLWVGTMTGLDRFDRTTGTFVHYLQGTVTSICEDSTGVLWIGTAGSGLIGLDRATGTVEYSYHHDANAPDDPGALSSDYVWTMYRDRDGTLWVGTSGGLDRFDRTTETLAHYRHDPDDPRSLGGSSVHAIHEDRQGVLWIGTYGGGLSQMNRSSGTFVRYRHNPEDPHSLCDDRVTSILEDSAGMLWIGTNDGLDQMDRDQNRFLHIQRDPLDPRSLSSDLVWSLYEDRSGVVWIGTSGGGVSKYTFCFILGARRQWTRDY